MDDLTPGIWNASVVITDSLSGDQKLIEFTTAVMSGNCSIQPVVQEVINDCDADSTGMIQVTSNGQAPYFYAWSDGQSTNPAVDLVAGTYTVTVTDSQGCTGEVSQVIGSETGLDKVCRILKRQPNVGQPMGQCEVSL